MDSAPLFDSVFFGVASAFFYSLYAILVKLKVQKVDSRLVLIGSMVLGSPLVLASALVFTPRFPLEFFYDFTLVARLLAASAFFAFGFHSFYQGLRKGRAAVFVPLVGLYSLVTLFGGLVLFNDPLTLPLLAALLLAIAGAFLSSQTKGLRGFSISPKSTSIEFLYAFRAIIGFGVGWLFFAPVLKSVGPYWAMLFDGILMVLFLSAAYRRDLRSLVGKADFSLVRAVSAITAVNVLASLSENVGVSSGLVTVVVPIVSTYPAMTALFGVVFLKEKIGPVQKIGILLVLSSIVFASLISAGLL